MVTVIRELLPDADPERRYDWLYRGGPDGPALTWLAVDDASGEAAGATSFFRRRMLLDGQVVSGALGGDGFVRPRFRRRGIAGAMHAASRRAMEEQGIAVMYGTPMPANRSPLAAAGAFDITETVRYARPVRAQALRLPSLLDPLLLVPRRTECELVPMAPLDARVDEVWRQTQPELQVAAVRDAAFYTWRFLQTPAQRHQAFVLLRGQEALAACALLSEGVHLYVVDLVAPRRRWPLMLQALARHARDTGHDRVELKLTRESAQHYGLLWSGFMPREAKPLNLLLPERCPHEVLLRDARRWYFTWADSDMD